jgi:hypothetical protein
MKEDNMLVFETKRILLYKNKSATHGQDGKSDMSRMNKLTKTVSSIQDTDSIATGNSTLFQREMVDICHLSIDKSWSRSNTDMLDRNGYSTAKLKLSYHRSIAEMVSLNKKVVEDLNT